MRKTKVLVKSSPKAFPADFFKQKSSDNSLQTASMETQNTLDEGENQLKPLDQWSQRKIHRSGVRNNSYRQFESHGEPLSTCDTLNQSPATNLPKKKPAFIPTGCHSTGEANSFTVKTSANSRRSQRRIHRKTSEPLAFLLRSEEVPGQRRPGITNSRRLIRKDQISMKQPTNATSESLTLQERLNTERKTAPKVRRGMNHSSRRVSNNELSRYLKRSKSESSHRVDLSKSHKQPSTTLPSNPFSVAPELVKESSLQLVGTPMVITEEPDIANQTSRFGGFSMGATIHEEGRQKRAASVDHQRPERVENIPVSTFAPTKQR